MRPIEGATLARQSVSADVSEFARAELEAFVKMKCFTQVQAWARVKNRIEDTGSLIIAKTPEQFAAQIAQEFEICKRVVMAQKLTLEQRCARRGRVAGRPT